MPKIYLRSLPLYEIPRGSNSQKEKKNGDGLRLGGEGKQSYYLMSVKFYLGIGRSSGVDGGDGSPDRKNAIMPLHCTL